MRFLFSVLTALVVTFTWAGAPAAAELQVEIVGAGTINFDPAGTACGPGCLEYTNWTLVTLTPAANPGWSFGEWRGPGNGSPERYVLMDGDKKLSAVFRQDPGTPTRIEVHPAEVINTDILGLGTNFHIMFVPQDSADRQAFYNLLKESGQTWIRVVPQYYEWENRNNDDVDPWTPPATFLADSYNGFAWNQGGQLPYGFKSLLDTCEAADIWLEINNWETALKDWLQPSYYTDPASYPIPYNRFNADATEFGENLAALIYYLKTVAKGGQGYECVKYWAVWNEPGGGHAGQDFINFDFPGTMNLLYQKVDAHLRNYDQLEGTNVHAQVQSIGFEGFPFFRDSPQAGHPMETWEEMVGRGILQYLEEPDGLPGEITNWPDGDPYMDIIAFHDYWSVFDYDESNPHDQNQGTLRDRFLDKLVRKTLEQIEQYDIDGQIEPVFISELGSKPYKQNPTSYEQSLFIMQGALRALQIDGVKAVNKWSFNTHYEWSMVSYPGFDWETPPLGTVHPVAASYFPFKLVARNLKRHSDVIKTSVLGGIDATSGGQSWAITETQRLWATAVRTPGGDEVVLFVINDSYEPEDVRLDFGPGISETLDKSYVSATSYQQISFDQLNQVPAAPGEFSDQLPPRSIVVYTGQYQTPSPVCLDAVTVLNPDGTQVDCAPYLCLQGACTTTCTLDGDCAPDFVCLEGVCTTSPADTCLDRHTVQHGDGGTTSCLPYECRNGACESSCTTNADCADDYSCEEQQCVETQPQPQCLDDWTLGNSDGTQTDCSPYECRNGACESSCTTNADCADGFSCEEQQCVETQPQPQCLDDWTLGNTDGTQSDCSPYRCSEAACLDNCASDQDCANGYECAKKRCSPEGHKQPAQTDGCQCSGSGNSPDAAAFIALLLLSVARRRRKPAGKK